MLSKIAVCTQWSALATFRRPSILLNQEVYHTFAIT